MRKQNCIRCVGDQTPACDFTNAVTDVNNIASTLVVKWSKHVSDSAKIAKTIISHWEGSCLKY